MGFEVSSNFADELRNRVNKGLKAALIVYTNEVKEVLSVPAPRIRVWVPEKTKTVTKDGVSSIVTRPGHWVYRVTRKAAPGAPPRKLSGTLRARQFWEVDDTESIGRGGTNVKYARRQELEYNHKFIEPTLQKVKTKMVALVGASVQFGAIGGEG